MNSIEQRVVDRLLTKHRAIRRELGALQNLGVPRSFPRATQEDR